MTASTPNSVLKRILVVRHDNNADDDAAMTIDPDSSAIQVDEAKNLNLIFLGCEAKPPYGPYEHTANLFLDLLETAFAEVENGRDAACKSIQITITLQVYHTSMGYFPTSEVLQESDGIILPGSFSSAYDNDPWIERLKELIQTELVAKELPTLGVCFGHQVYAHSFDHGSAVQCPAGPQAGRKTSQLTDDGKRFLNGGKADDGLGTNKILDLFYTHGDMVEKLPSNAFAIGGNDCVPIQAAIYRSQNSIDGKIVAVTFQAHPEYASSRDKGLALTLENIIDAMQKRGDITEQERENAKADASQQYENVREQSLRATIRASQALGWFS
jgi:GMP synthase-like glutamine amidotransferase